MRVLIDLYRFTYDFFVYESNIRHIFFDGQENWPTSVSMCCYYITIHIPFIVIFTNFKGIDSRPRLILVDSLIFIEKEKTDSVFVFRERVDNKDLAVLTIQSIDRENYNDTIQNLPSDFSDEN